MRGRTYTRARSGGRETLVLFLSLFAAQAAVICLAPILTTIARDFGVSTSAVGQLRTGSALIAAVTALGLGTLARRVDLRRLLLTGLALLGAGSAASAAAPALHVLALGQGAIGLGVGLVVGTALAATSEWVPAERRGRVLSLALIGQPAAWIVGMPMIGLVAEAGGGMPGCPCPSQPPSWPRSLPGERRARGAGPPPRASARRSRGPG